MGRVALYEWVLVRYRTRMLEIEGSPPIMNTKQASQARSTGHSTNIIDSSDDGATSLGRRCNGGMFAERWPWPCVVVHRASSSDGCTCSSGHFHVIDNAFYSWLLYVLRRATESTRPYAHQPGSRGCPFLTCPNSPYDWLKYEGRNDGVDAAHATIRVYVGCLFFVTAGLP